MNEIRKLINLMEGVMAVPGLNEKSKSEKQARFMAAAAHDPKFAKKVGIDQSVAKEFNKADTGTELLSKATKSIKEDQEWDSLVEEMRTYVEELMSQGMSLEDAVSEVYRNTSSDYAITALDQVMHDMKNGESMVNDMFEGASPLVHTFGDSGEAYDATQTGYWWDDINSPNAQQVEVKDGDILVIPSEGVVGVCSTWPVAVTKNSGKLHAMKSEFSTPEDIAEVTKLPVAAIHAAFKKAQELGFETVGDIKEDLNNGYHDVNVSNGQDYFPNGADGPVVKKIGPSGAKQGDNPEQKKMQVVDEHKELVYAYRKFLKESEINAESKKKLTENKNNIVVKSVIDQELDWSNDGSELSCFGVVGVTSILTDSHGTTYTLYCDVDISSTALFSWRTHEEPTGWNYAIDAPSYSYFDYVEVNDPEFQSIKIYQDGEFKINNNSVSQETFQKFVGFQGIRVILDPKNYIGFVNEIYNKMADNIEKP